MPKRSRPRAGTIIWRDLTVPNAEQVRAFYADVVGWRSEVHDDDYNMFAPGGKEPIAGICHRVGANKKLPAQWLIYISVPDLDDSLSVVPAHGGRVIDGPRRVGQGRIAVVRDPAGAHVALFEPPKR